MNCRILGAMALLMTLLSASWAAAQMMAGPAPWAMPPGVPQAMPMPAGPMGPQPGYAPMPPGYGMAAPAGYGAPMGYGYAPMPGMGPVQPAAYAQAYPTYDAGSCDAAGCDAGGCETGYCGDNCGDGSFLSRLRCGSLFGGECGLLGGLGCGVGCGAHGGGYYGDDCSDPYGNGNGNGNGNGRCNGAGCCGCLLGGYGGCCTPRWFDVRAEWLYWTREYSGALALTSVGILGPDVMDLDDLGFQEQSGARVTIAYPFRAAGSIEFDVLGGFNWSSSTEVFGDGNLYSVFSDFGASPLNGFPETDEANYHSVAISTELDSTALNLRHRWVSAGCVMQGSTLIGVRYIRLREDLVHETFTDLGEMSYQLKTDNDLVGSQIGGDLYFSITPRFKVGGEIAAGLYGIHAKQRTNVFCTSCDPLRETGSESDVAFAGEGSVVALFRVTPRFTLRAGYTAMHLNGIATAPSNFNTASPFATRDTFVSASDEMTFHGSNVGFEFVW